MRRGLVLGAVAASSSLEMRGGIAAKEVYLVRHAESLTNSRQRALKALLTGE